LSTLGDAINNLIASLPQIMVLAMVYRLVFNELIHITVEPFKPPEKEENLRSKIVEAIKYHKSVYGQPASPEYVASYVYMEPARKMLDEWIGRKKDEVENVRRLLESMAAEGKVVAKDGKYDVA